MMYMRQLQAHGHRDLIAYSYPRTVDEAFGRHVAPQEIVSAPAAHRPRNADQWDEREWRAQCLDLNRRNLANYRASSVPEPVLGFRAASCCVGLILIVGLFVVGLDMFIWRPH